MGEIVGGTILFGEPDAEPLLGVTVLESVGIEVDPLNQRLKPTAGGTGPGKTIDCLSGRYGHDTIVLSLDNTWNFHRSGARRPTDL